MYGDRYKTRLEIGKGRLTWGLFRLDIMLQSADEF